VIVGVHGPLVNTYGNEYPHYFRATEHEHADPDQTRGFFWRRLAATLRDPSKFSVIEHVLNHDEWFLSGRREIKVAGRGDLLDFGVSKGKAEELLDLCVGRGATRPVDLILCGHQHRNAEYHVGLDIQNRFSFSTDFYSENPAEYYPSYHITGDDVLHKRDGSRVHVRVQAGADPHAAPAHVRDHPNGETAWDELKVPPFADTLGTSANKAAWWRRWRPIHAQTAALGPIDMNQRRRKPANEVDERRATPFQGFRIGIVRSNTISALHYVRFPDLRANKGVMPWEPTTITVPPGSTHTLEREQVRG